MKVRPSLLFLTIIATTVLSTSSAQAQRGGTVMGGLAGKHDVLELLKNDKVQKELAIGEETMDQIDSLNSEYRSELQGFMEGLRSSGRAGMEDFRERWSEVRGKYNAKVPDILNEDQMDRLKQLQFQMALSQGLVRALDGPLGEELAATDDLKAKLKVKAAEVAKWEADEIERIRAEAREKLNSVLPEEMRQKIAELAGEKFDFGPQRIPRSGVGSGGIMLPSRRAPDR